MALTFEPENIRKNVVIDYSYDLIYIELGTNDRGNEIAAELRLSMNRVLLDKMFGKVAELNSLSAVKKDSPGESSSTD